MAEESVFEKMGQWTREKIDLIKRTIVPRGISDDEFALFVAQCQRSGLDPLLRQAYCVPRETKGPKVKNPDGSDKLEQWSDKSWHPVFEKITKYEFQPSRDGMLVRANRFPDFLGLQASEVYAEDEIKITYSEDGALSSVLHSFNPAKRKGSLVGAWARVARQGKLPVLVWVDFAAFVQNSPLWKGKPAVMICKVAEATALRKAYPEAFGGLYIAGERPDDGQAEEPEAEASPVPRLTRPVLPEETATRLSTPTLERAPEAVLVGAVQAGDGGTPEAATTLDESALNADSICSEAASVVETAKAAAGDEAAQARARADLEALAVRARKLPKDTAARNRAAKALQDAKAQLKGGAA